LYVYFKNTAGHVGGLGVEVLVYIAFGALCECDFYHHDTGVVAYELASDSGLYFFPFCGAVLKKIGRLYCHLFSI
jgi:hypothetical protein